MIRIRLSALVSRVPVIKFRKGNTGTVGGATAGPNAGAVNVGGASPAAQPAVAMSTIHDSRLPARYRRTPLSEEEIAIINGGGIKDTPSFISESKSAKEPQMLGTLKIPQGILVKSPGGKGEVVSLNVILQKR